MRKADNLSPFCAVVTKAGNLNFLEPSGPLRACNGYLYGYLYSILPDDGLQICPKHIKVD